MAVHPLDPRERARLDGLARRIARILARGIRLRVRRERSVRGAYLEHALDMALLDEYHAARERLQWVDPRTRRRHRPAARLHATRTVAARTRMTPP